VTTPERVWLYWNAMVHRRGPDEILSLVGDVCRQAVAEAAGRLADRAKSHGGGRDVAPVAVMSFAELRSQVLDGDATARPTLFRAGRENC
jgi:arginine utilization protein RocB